MKPDEYAEVAELWDSHYNAHPVTAAEDKLITSVVRKAYRRGMKVLDIGCGTGMALENVDIHPHDYLGVDVSPSMLRVARRKFRYHRFVLDDAEELSNVSDDSIDLGMFLFGVFPFTDPQKSLKQLYRVLRPNATFLVTFYHVNFPMSGSDGYQAAFYANNLVPPMAYFYTVKEAKVMFLKFSLLKVTEIVTINSYLDKVEKIVPKKMRVNFMRRFAVLESALVSRFAPELCHHFVLVGRKHGSQVS